MGKNRLTPRRFAIGLVLAWSACAGQDPFVVNRERLEWNLGRVDRGDLSGACADLERFLAETSPEAWRFRMQRCYAAYLLAQAHIAASAGGAFLGSPSGVSAGGLGSGASDPPFATAHVVAAMMWAHLCKDLLPAAESASAREGDVELLPTSLRARTFAQVSAALDVIVLVVHARLGFEDRVAKTLESSSALCEIVRCEQLLEESGVALALRPWVYRTVFHYLRDRDEPAAYLFGVRMLETASDARGTLGKADSDAVIDWIRHGSRYDFKCPSCNRSVIPEMRACEEDQIPHRLYYAERKPQQQ